MRERLFTLVEKAAPGDRLGKAYDVFIVAVAFISVVPLMFKGSHPALDAIDLVTVYILFADYIFRWMTADFAAAARAGRDGAGSAGRRQNSGGAAAFVRYPFTPYAIISLVSLLPSMGLLGPAFRMLRMLRIFTIFHYSDNFRYIAHVFRKEKRTLTSVLVIALFYIFVSALVMFSYEPDTFDNFFDALYWATTALTTVGYGDVYPVSAIGKLISMVSSLFGIAVIALPAGIVTAGFVDEINKSQRQEADAAEAEEVFEELGMVERQPLFRVTPNVKRHAAVMFFCVALNFGLNLLSQTMGWPVWLDVTGTAFAAMVLGAPAGLLVGLINNMLLALLEYGTASLMYYASSAVVALLAGVFIFKGGRLRAGRVVLALGLAVVLPALIGGGLDMWISAGGPPNTPWENHYYGLMQAGGVPHGLSYLLAEGAVKVFDTLATAAVVAVLYAAAPKKLKAARWAVLDG